MSFVFYAQQNWVPNPSFEDTAIGCPNNSGQINRAKNWFTINGSPDYFNRCYNGPSNYNTLPLNSFTYQEPTSMSCNAYAGFFTASPLNNLNEIFAVKLIDSLKIGVRYFFTCKASLSNFSKYGTNNLGVLLNTNQPLVTSTASPTNFAQINFNQAIVDTLNWKPLFKSFISDSNYRYLSLGNFKDSSLTTKVYVNSGGGNQTYYVIDDVCISNDSTFAYNYSFNCTTVSIKENLDYKQIKIYPNPSDNFIIIDTDLEYCSYSINDFNGRQLINSKLDPNLNKIDISNYNNGIYIIRLFDCSKNIIGTQKLIILKP